MGQVESMEENGQTEFWAGPSFRPSTLFFGQGSSICNLVHLLLKQDDLDVVKVEGYIQIHEFRPKMTECEDRCINVFVPLIIGDCKGIYFRFKILLVKCRQTNSCHDET